MIRGARFVESVKVQFTVPISFILEGIKRAQKFPPVSKKLEIESQAEFAISNSDIEDSLESVKVIFSRVGLSD